MKLFSYIILTTIFLIPYVHLNLEKWLKTIEPIYTIVDSNKIE
jgi:hypothetical protein